VSFGTHTSTTVRVRLPLAPNPHAPRFRCPAFSCDMTVVSCANRHAYAKRVRGELEVARFAACRGCHIGKAHLAGRPTPPLDRPPEARKPQKKSRPCVRCGRPFEPRCRVRLCDRCQTWCAWPKCPTPDIPVHMKKPDQTMHPRCTAAAAASARQDQKARIRSGKTQAEWEQRDGGTKPVVLDEQDDIDRDIADRNAFLRSGLTREQWERRKSASKKVVLDHDAGGARASAGSRPPLVQDADDLPAGGRVAVEWYERQMRARGMDSRLRLDGETTPTLVFGS